MLEQWAHLSSSFVACLSLCLQRPSYVVGDQSWLPCLAKSLACDICSFSQIPGWTVVLGGLRPERPTSWLELLCPSEMPNILSNNSLNKANVICLNICPHGLWFLLFISAFWHPKLHIWTVLYEKHQTVPRKSCGDTSWYMWAQWRTVVFVGGWAYDSLP